ncbi:MAG: 30S ribosomal protein S16 [Deltaproteobacteria bacterium]|nr:30S ribosomal protein S16 [Deltaproteobacteria bacterium]
MAVKIRLARGGARNRPFYRIVVAESSFPRNGRFIERVGYYDPAEKPTLINVNIERVEYWLQKGARPTDTVARLIKTFKRPLQTAKTVNVEATASSENNEEKNPG